jgi:hypothetical protein
MRVNEMLASTQFNDEFRALKVDASQLLNTASAPLLGPLITLIMKSLKRPAAMAQYTGTEPK